MPETWQYREWEKSLRKSARPKGILRSPFCRSRRSVSFPRVHEPPAWDYFSMSPIPILSCSSTG